MLRRPIESAARSGRLDFTLILSITSAPQWRENRPATPETEFNLTTELVIMELLGIPTDLLREFGFQSEDDLREKMPRVHELCCEVVELSDDKLDIWGNVLLERLSEKPKSISH